MGKIEPSSCITLLPDPIIEFEQKDVTFIARSTTNTKILFHNIIHVNKNISIPKRDIQPFSGLIRAYICATVNLRLKKDQIVTFSKF